MSIILKQFYKHEEKSQFFSDFTELQRKSFLNFLNTGLIEELSNRNPIRNNKNNIELIFYPEYYKLKTQMGCSSINSIRKKLCSRTLYSSPING